MTHRYVAAPLGISPRRTPFMTTATAVVALAVVIGLALAAPVATAFLRETPIPSRTTKRPFLRAFTLDPQDDNEIPGALSLKAPSTLRTKPSLLVRRLSPSATLPRRTTRSRNEHRQPLMPCTTSAYSTLQCSSAMAPLLWLSTSLPTLWRWTRRGVAGMSPRTSLALWGLAGCLLVLYTIQDVVTTRQRQRIDPTSEWERYAASPSARGRAVAYLVLVQLVPLWIQMAWWRLLTTNSNTQDALQTRAGQVVANGLLRLGPLYIKLGQIVSSRSPLVPVSWQESLARLQDQVPAYQETRAQALAYATWPGGRSSWDATFDHVDWTPLAAASLGQVHTAVYRATNATVAIKVQRPKLREIYHRDFALLTRLATWVDTWWGSSAGSVGGVSQRWTDIFATAQEIMVREIDYRAEAAHGIRFARDFGVTYGGQAAAAVTKSREGPRWASAAAWVRAPYVYANVSTEQVLVMEYVPSIKITAADKLDAANVTVADKEYLADCLGRSYLRQFCSHKFFSTDPHGGNLGVELLNMKSTVPSERVRLVFYDFGQVAELEQNQADGILEMIESIVDLDVDRSVEAFQQMGVLKENADLAAVRAKVADNFRTGKIKANRKRLSQRGYQFRNDTESIEPPVTDNEQKVSDAQVMQYFTLPTEYAFVGRALTQMDGVGKSLDPDFDFVSASAPWIVEVKGAGRYVQDEALKWIANICNQFRNMVSPGSK